uniref:V-SNARE coiled-coil homology domain-containing protein n=1 Tax=Lactuca sativa TaxID=4236 RepID=A0A9R1XQW8_LACSA|nr:hypothetical protein LSAT_V11C200065580 [Lactuca sativa]
MTCTSKCLSEVNQSQSQSNTLQCLHVMSCITLIRLSLRVVAYCVVAVESAGRELPIAFLERIKDDFYKRYGTGKGKTANAKGLNREFGSKMKEHMRYCISHPEEISKVAKVKAQVSEVKGVMMENIEKVLDRGEKIELLVDKTDNLRNQAQDFKKQGTKMKRKMWFQNMKVKLIVNVQHLGWNQMHDFLANQMKSMKSA